MTDPRVDGILAALAREARVPVPDALDRRTRRMLLAFPGAARRPLRVAAAAGLSLAACLALIAALGIGFAAAGLAEQGPPLALIVVIIYLALSAAASAPILLIGRRRLGLAGGSSR